jgi:hypothetical protein
MSKQSQYPKCPGCGSNYLKPWAGKLLLHCARGHVWEVKMNNGKRVCVCTNSLDDGAKIGDTFEWTE